MKLVDFKGIEGFLDVLKLSLVTIWSSRLFSGLGRFPVSFLRLSRQSELLGTTNHNVVCWLSW
jgi:hypothetical protein